MKFVLLALVVAMLPSCGSTKSESTGPCPKRTEPMAGSGCAVEGTTCEYVIALTCQTDEYVCTAGKWEMTNRPDAAVGCVGPPHVDGGADAAIEAAIPDAATE